MKKHIRNLVVWLLTCEAKAVLRKYKPQIIAVTGSVGKTSTKDAIYTALNASLYVRKNNKSFNSEIGVPLTILGLDTGWGSPVKWLGNLLRGLTLIIFPNHYPKWLVLEVGLDKPGDIENVACWLQPDVAVFTKLSETPVHVEFFKDAKELLQEKKKLAEHLKPGGTVIINEDDPLLASVKNTPHAHFVTYGFAESAHVQGTNEGVLTEIGMTSGIHMKVESGGASVPVMLKGVVGRQHLYPVLAAFAVGVSQGLNPVSIAGSFAEHAHAPGRMRLIDGVRGSQVIDDSYNASPVAVAAALDTIESMRARGRRMAILGDMAELGDLSESAHRNIGIHAARVLDVLVGVGKESRTLIKAAQDAGMNKKTAMHLDDARAAGEYIKGIVKMGDVVLVKGSQSIRTERAVEILMARPEQKTKLLVRQEAEWMRR